MISGLPNTPEERRMALQLTEDADIDIPEYMQPSCDGGHMALRDWMGMPHERRKGAVMRVARKYGREGHYPPPLTKTQIMLWAREAIMQRKGV